MHIAQLFCDIVNRGFKKRFDYCKLSKKICTMSPLYLDFAQSHNVIPGNSRLSLTLQHAPDSFRLMSAAEKEGDYKLIVEKCELLVTQVKLGESITRYIENKMALEHYLRYQLKRISCSGPHQILAGTSIFTKQVQRGPKPACIFAFFTRTKASEGFSINKVKLLIEIYCRRHKFEPIAI